jgi:exodeoxyribonuclease VII large subunit
VADLRAPTPSAAAELIVADATELMRRVAELENCLQKYLRNFLQQSLTRLRFLSERTLGRELMQRMRDAQQQLDLTAESLRRRLKQFVVDARAALSTHAQALKTCDPKREVALCRNSVIDLRRRLAAQPSQLLQNAQQRFQRVEGMLRVLGPDATLRRGYSITTDAAGNVIQTVAAVRPKSKIRTRVADGEFESEVT